MAHGRSEQTARLGGVRPCTVGYTVRVFVISGATWSGHGPVYDSMRIDRPVGGNDSDVRRVLSDAQKEYCNIIIISYYVLPTRLRSKPKRLCVLSQSRRALYERYFASPVVCRRSARSNHYYYYCYFFSSRPKSKTVKGDFIYIFNRARQLLLNASTSVIDDLLLPTYYIGRIKQIHCGRRVIFLFVIFIFCFSDCPSSRVRAIYLVAAKYDCLFQFVIMII